jgi:hypothetical protein
VSRFYKVNVADRQEAQAWVDDVVCPKTFSTT